MKNWAILQFHLCLIVMFDSLMLGYFAHCIIQISFIFVFSILSIYVALGSYLNELDAKLLKFIQKLNATTNINQISYISRTKELINNLFAHFHSKYVYIFTIIIQLDKKLVSKIMWIAMMGNFSLNIYSVALLSVRKNLLVEEMAFLLSAFLCQIYLISTYIYLTRKSFYFFCQ